MTKGFHQKPTKGFHQIYAKREKIKYDQHNVNDWVGKGISF